MGLGRQDLIQAEWRGRISEMLNGKATAIGVIGVAMVAALSAARPPRPPTTAPTDNPAVAIAEQEKLIKSIRDRIDQLRTERERSFTESPERKAAIEDRDAKLAALERARKSGNRDEVLRTSSEYTAAKQKVERIESSFVPTEEETGLPEHAVKAERGLIALRNYSKAEEQRRAEEEAEHRAIAARADEIKRKIANAPVVSAKQVEVTGERYADSFVRLEGWTFTEATNEALNDLPGIVVQSDGFVSYVDEVERDKWIGCRVSDPKNQAWDQLFARKDKWADTLINMKPGSRFDALCYVIKLRGAGKYGLVIIELKPPKQ